MSLFDKITSRFNISETKMKVFRNLCWAVLGKIITLLGGLIVGIFVARYLGPEQYGLMNYIISYVALFQILATFGLDQIEIREESKSAKDRDVIVGTAFTSKCVFAVLTMILVVVTAFLFEADSFTQMMITVYSLSIILSSFSVIRNHFTALVWNEYIVKTEISRTLIGVALKVGLLLLHAPLVWFIIALLFDSLLLASGYCLAYRKKIGKFSLWHFDKEWAKYLIKQSFPLLLSGAAIIVYQRIDQIMIGNMIDKASVGQFSVASKFVEMLIFVPTILSQTMGPILIRIRENSIEEYEKKAQMFMNITFWLCLLLAILVSLIAYPLIIWTFGAQYIAAVSILQIMSFKVLGATLGNISGQMIIIEKKQKYVVFRNIIGCVTCIGLNLLFIPQFGAKGAAIVAVWAILTADYIAHLIIPSYRHLFVMQTRAILIGWKDLIHINKLLK